METKQRFLFNHLKKMNIISEAMEFSNPVQFSVFKPLPLLNGPETGEIVQIEGHIHYINQLRKLFHVVDSKGDTNLIKFEDVVSVEINNPSL
ncbi:YolD-like family protein [Bacillus paralicheniformis]|nr:YolD-like family protein [Bacillus paralicheniformis]MED1218816.1 YolD-like family protein [Bacillus paralicheniformis]